jgi:flagellar motility protein MotE (MotC chaperone)
MLRKPFTGTGLGTGLVLAAMLCWAPAVQAATEQPDVLDTSVEAIVDEATQERDKIMAEREQLLTEQETRLTRMRADLEALISRNESLRKELAKRQEKIETASSEKMRKLIKVYEAMAPEEAAPILNEMKESVVLSLFSGMKGKSAAGIMELIPKPKAARLGEKLAKPY